MQQLTLKDSWNLRKKLPLVAKRQLHPKPTEGITILETLDIPSTSKGWDESAITYQEDGDYSRFNGWNYSNGTLTSVYNAETVGFYVEKSPVTVTVNDEPTVVPFTTVRIYDDIVNSSEHYIEVTVHDPENTVFNAVSTVRETADYFNINGDGKLEICKTGTVEDPEPEKPAYITFDPEAYDFPTATVGGENIHPQSEVIIETSDVPSFDKLFDIDAAKASAISNEPNYGRSNKYNLKNEYNSFNGWVYPDGVTPEDMVNNKLYLFNSGSSTNYEIFEATRNSEIFALQFFRLEFYLNGDFTKDPIYCYLWKYNESEGSCAATAEQIARMEVYESILQNYDKMEYLYLTSEGKMQFLGHDPVVGNECVKLKIPLLTPLEQNYRKYNTGVDEVLSYRFWESDSKSSLEFLYGWEGATFEELCNAASVSVGYGSSSDTVTRYASDNTSTSTTTMNVNMNYFNFSFADKETGDNKYVRLYYYWAANNYHPDKEYNFIKSNLTNFITTNNSKYTIRITEDKLLIIENINN